MLIIGVREFRELMGIGLRSQKQPKKRKGRSKGKERKPQLEPTISPPRRIGFSVDGAM